MLRTLLVLAILIPGIAAAAVNRSAALLLYIWFALFRPMEWVWVDLSGLRLSLVVGALLVLPSLATGVLPTVTHPLMLGAFAFLGTCILSAIDAVRPEVAWHWIDFLFRLVLVCGLAVTIVSDQKRFRLTIAVIAGSLGFHAAKAGVVSLLGGGVRFAEGLPGAWGDNNGYAVGMVMILPLLLAAGQNFTHRWIKRGFLLAAPLTAFSVISTFSRGGLLGLIACAVTLVMVQRRRALALIGLVVMAVPLGIFMTQQKGYLDRVQTITTYEEVNETSALSRLHFWRVAIAMAEDHPLGVGLYNFESAYNRYDTTGGEFGLSRSVHSSHFQVLAETGFPGLVIWLSTFSYAFFCAFRIRKRGKNPNLTLDDQRLFTTAANGLIASMVGFLVGGAFVAMALNDVTWLTFAMIAALDRISARCCAEAGAEDGVTPRAPQMVMTGVAALTRPRALPERHRIGVGLRPARPLPRIQGH